MLICYVRCAKKFRQAVASLLSCELFGPSIFLENVEISVDAIVYVAKRNVAHRFDLGTVTNARITDPKARTLRICACKKNLESSIFQIPS